MRYTEAERLQSEIGTVERFLAELPEDAVIERRSWESRLAALRAERADVAARPPAHPLSLTFRGAPVEGSRSIDATFASKAVRAFVEATDTVTASLVTDELRERGRLPGPRTRSLRIVDTAEGSFGFELELPPPTEPPQQTLFDADTADPYVDAVATTLELLARAAADDEDRLSDLIAKTHPRAADKVQAFAQVLAEHDAVVAAAFGGTEVRLDTVEQVRRVTAWLRSTDIVETYERVGGMLQGVLPHSRRFEARLAAGDRVIAGAVGRNVTDIGRFKADWENRAAVLELRVIRVRTRTRYVLVGATAQPQDGPDEGTPP